MQSMTSVSCECTEQHKKSQSNMSAQPDLRIFLLWYQAAHLDLLIFGFSGFFDILIFTCVMINQITNPLMKKMPKLHMIRVLFFTRMIFVKSQNETYNIATYFIRDQNSYPLLIRRIENAAFKMVI